MNSKLNELLTRSLTGLIFVVLVILAIFIHPWAAGFLFLIITVLSLHEFYNLASAGSIKPYKVSGIMSGAGLFICFFIYGYTGGEIRLFPYLFILLLIIASEGLFRRTKYFPNTAITLTGILYTALPLALMNLFLFPLHNEMRYTPCIAAGYFIILWSFDTGAYVTGKPLGKHKMVPVISPAKSWEGFAGGIIIAAVVCYVTGTYYTVLSRIDWYVMLLMIIILGTAGDLFESVLKRNAGVKDSGTLMPGHGGVLDRFDSVFFSLPVFAMYYLIKYKLICC